MPENPDASAPDKGKRVASKKQAEATPLDPAAILVGLLAKANLEHNPETEDEVRSRLAIAEKDADHERTEKAKGLDHRRHVEIVSLYAVIVITAIVCPTCLWVLTDDTKSAERKAWAAPLLTLIVGGLIGFLTGRVPGRPQEK